MIYNRCNWQKDIYVPTTTYIKIRGVQICGSAHCTCVWEQMYWSAKMRELSEEMRERIDAGTYVYRSVLIQESRDAGAQNTGAFVLDFLTLWIQSIHSNVLLALFVQERLISFLLVVFGHRDEYWMSILFFSGSVVWLLVWLVRKDYTMTFIGPWKGVSLASFFMYCIVFIIIW